uniref:Ubiquitin-like protease family profile domain-containing protein n=1 Tax=Fagus sylvatica TaxID=28930 RepID=A0A2N9HD38_FAGSY
MSSFNNSDNVLCVLAAMPWEQQESVLTVQGCQERQTCQKEGLRQPWWTWQAHHRSGTREADLAKNEGEAAMVDLASSPSKGAMVDLMSSPFEGSYICEWVDAHFLYQPTADDEAVLVDLRKKWSGVDSNEVAFSTETYEIMGREVSSFLGDQESDSSSRWISTATIILASSWSTTTQRNKIPKKGKQPIEDDQPGPETVFRSSWIRTMPEKCNLIFVPTCHNGHFVILVVDYLDKAFYFYDSLPSATHRAWVPILRKALEQLCVENLGHQDVKIWLLEHKKDIPNQVRYIWMTSSTAAAGSDVRRRRLDIDFTGWPYGAVAGL